MKRLGVFLLFPAWDAGPSQGYPPALNSPVLIYTLGWNEVLRELSVLPKNTTQCPRRGLELEPLDPESRAPTMRPHTVIANEIHGEMLALLSTLHSELSSSFYVLVTRALIDLWYFNRSMTTRVSKT